MVAPYRISNASTERYTCILSVIFQNKGKSVLDLPGIPSFPLNPFRPGNPLNPMIPFSPFNPGNPGDPYSPESPEIKYYIMNSQPPPS